MSLGVLIEVSLRAALDRWLWTTWGRRFLAMGPALLYWAAGSLVAFLGWYDRGQFGFALLLFGPLLMAAGLPLRAFAAAFGYYAVLGWEEVAALSGFFSLHVALSVALWIAHAAVNALPWAAALLAAYRWRHRLSPALLGSVNLVVGSWLSLMGPWAAISWGHPLFAAGDLYPGAGVWGVVAVVLWWLALGLTIPALVRGRMVVWIIVSALIFMSSLGWHLRKVCKTSSQPLMMRQ